MDAIALLSSDHRKLRLLFGEYRVADTDRRRRAAADTLIRELSKHVAAEEMVFYPYAEKVLDAKATRRTGSAGSDAWTTGTSPEPPF